MRLTEESFIEMHVMCDALKDAYGTIFYIIVQSGHHVSFFMAKNQGISSIYENWSIPHEELTAVNEGVCIAVLS